MEDAIYMLNIGLRYGLALFVFLYCIASFIFSSKNKSLVYFAIYLLFFVLSSMVEQPFLVERLFNITNIETYLKITHSLTSISLMLFLNSVMDVNINKRKIEYILSSIVISSSIINILFFNTYIPVVYEIARFSTYAGGVIYAYIAYEKEKNGDLEGLYLSIAFMISIIFILLEMFKILSMHSATFKTDDFYLGLYFAMSCVIGLIYTFLLKTIFAARLKNRTNRQS